MSNDLTLLQQGGQLPAYLQGNVGATDGLITSGESLPRISIKGFKFTLKTKENEVVLAPVGTPLDVVILAVDPPNKNVGRVFFTSGYSGDSDKPDCSSANGVYPDEWIEEPQSRTCADCPKAVWGSATNAKGNKVKACSDHKRLIVVPPDAIDGELAVIQVPPTSLKALSGYGRKLLKLNAPLAGLVTRLSFDQTVEHPKLEFDAVSFLPEEVGAKALERAASDELQDQLHAAAQPPAEQATAGAELLEHQPAAESQEPVQETVQARPPQERMTAKANGVPYEKFKEDPNWTDELMIQHGYLEAE